MAQNGCDAAEIAEKMEKLKPRVRASFVVDTLMYLYRGGRCGGLTTLAGGALKIHPRIVVAGGEMSPDRQGGRIPWTKDTLPPVDLWGRASRIIKDTVTAGLIKPLDPDTAPRYMRYIPAWA